MQYMEKKRLLFFGLPWTFTKYTVTDEFITVNSGLLRQEENDCYLYKIIDVRLETSLAERIFGLGTVHCFSGDVTDPDLKLQHIRHAKEIKNYILKQSEEERLKRKTLNTQSLDGSADMDAMGQIDSCDL
ncbi:MAG: PH domain-containing protein [Lachnospiraceae bacterium]|nr:PH domain-containing protein [Lachnospiraceae bacterium]